MVLIIGILAAIALPQYTRVVERSRAAEGWTVLGNIATAEQIYQMSHGSYTVHFSELDLDFPGLSGDTITTNNFTITAAAADGDGLTITADRRDGAWDYALTLGLTKTGAITRGCTGDDKACAAALAGVTKAAAAAAAEPAEPAEP